MSYNTEKLIDIQERFKVEAQAALYLIAEKYNTELITTVQSELPDSHYICSAMGSAFKCSMKVGTYYDDDEFTNILNEIVWGDGIIARLDLPYKFTNKHVLTSEQEKEINEIAKSKGLKSQEQSQLQLKLQNSVLRTGKINKKLANKFGK